MTVRPNRRRSSGVKTTSGEQSQPVLRSDNPISSSDEDSLGRKDLARRFADDVLRIDYSEGLVVGVVGPWGSGKTSFVTMASERFEQRGVVRLNFNPWMFSGAEQLIEAFFVEVSAQLRIRPEWTEIATKLSSYGDALSGFGWLPVIGTWVERGRFVTNAFKAAMKSRERSMESRREELKAALAERDSVLLVVLDDIDRLVTDEIRTLFRLVRLTASFPNVIYLLSFDRQRVETALTEDGTDGRSYLDKIMQWSTELPSIPAQILNQQTHAALNEVLGDVGWKSEGDEHRWTDTYYDVVAPLIRTPRDVRRFALAASSAATSAAGRIALTDILALEAIRTFLPDLFAYIRSSPGSLTATSGRYGGTSDNDGRAIEIDQFIASAGERGVVARKVIELLFPAALVHIGGNAFDSSWKQTWLRERRVAHAEVLNFYLEQVAGTELTAFEEAEIAFSRMDNLDAFEEHLDRVDGHRLGDVISALEVFEADFEPRHVPAGCLVLLRALPRVEARDVTMFTLRPEITVSRVVLRLLKTIEEEGEREFAVDMILTRDMSLQAHLLLIDTVGDLEGVGHNLVSVAASRRLESAWRARVSTTAQDSPRELAREGDLLRLSVRMRHGDADWSMPDTPEVTLALLRSAQSDVTSQAVGSRFVTSTTELHWESLVHAVGSEEELRRRVSGAHAISTELDMPLFTLIENYLSGWRPDRFGMNP